MKKIVSLLLSLVIMMTIVPVNAVAAEKGDINEDGKITVEDVYLARLFSAKVRTPNNREKNLADMDGDGNITAIDANYIRKAAIKAEDESPDNMTDLA